MLGFKTETRGEAVVPHSAHRGIPPTLILETRQKRMMNRSNAPAKIMAPSFQNQQIEKQLLDLEEMF
ncbi:MAG: hypothetical protein JXR76_17630 [Deltaproteobacteria bacterium]|nr:hypothetical protein [Deltaproteobacteria bacterium]